MMRDRGAYWDELPETDKLALVAEASVVLAASRQIMNGRTTFLRALIGKRWEANARGPDAFDCWHLAQHVERHLFGRKLPDVEVPYDLTWSGLLAIIESHPERANWGAFPQHDGLICANDGALVLMARAMRAAHFGVWLAPERGVIHCDRPGGVMFEDPATLRASGWRRLMFYEPRAPHPTPPSPQAGRGSLSSKRAKRGSTDRCATTTP
jgi:hypothetical protein